MALLKHQNRDGPSSMNSKKYSQFLLSENDKELVVGRDFECNIRIPNIEISRRHAKLKYENGAWYIWDLKSTNGIYVNNSSLNGSIHQLHHNDLVSFGPSDKTEFNYKFLITKSESSHHRIFNQINRDQNFNYRNNPDPLPSCSMSSNSTKVEKSQDLLINLKNDDFSKTERKKGERIEGEHIKQLQNELQENKQTANEYRKKLKTQEMLHKKRKDEILMLKKQLEEQKKIANDAIQKKEEADLKKNQEEKLVRQLKEKAEKQRKDLENLKDQNQNPNELKRKSSGERDDGLKSLKKTELIKDSSAIQQKYEQIFDSELTCSVCHELFIEPIILNCSHTFCSFCIEQWKRNHLSRQECPICRKGITDSTKALIIQNLLDKIILSMDESAKEQRDKLIEERMKNLTSNDKGSSLSNSNTRRLFFSPDRGDSSGIISMDFVSNPLISDYYNDSSDSSSNMSLTEGRFSSSSFDWEDEESFHGEEVDDSEEDYEEDEDNVVDGYDVTDDDDDDYEEEDDDDDDDDDNSSNVFLRASPGVIIGERIDLNDSLNPSDTSGSSDGNNSESYTTANSFSSNSVVNGTFDDTSLMEVEVHTIDDDDDDEYDEEDDIRESENGYTDSD